MFKRRTSITEDNFINELISKNEDAMEFVIKNYGRLYKSIVCKYMKDMSYVEECLDDIFLNIWNNIDKFDNERSNFINWSCALSRYRCIDMMRKHKLHNERFLDLDVDENQEIFTDFLKSEDSYDYCNDDFDDLTNQTLDKLSNQDRKILLDAYVNEKELSEISKDMNINMSSVYNKLSRARKRFKLIYGGKNEKCL